MDAKFDLVSSRIGSLEKIFEVKIDSLEKRLQLAQELAEIKVRLVEVEKRTGTR